MKASAKWSVSAVLALCVAGPVAGKETQQAVENFIATECSPLLEPAPARRAMQLVRAQLLAQGMKLLVQACPFVRVSAGHMRQVVDVRVQVLNSEVAADFVRGPLADGEEVDMGGVHFRVPSLARGLTDSANAEQEDDVSPDVLFNRQWLAKAMSNRGLHVVEGHWWAFVPTAARP